MSTQVLKEIRSRIDAETRSPQVIYSELQAIGAQMVVMRVLSREQVVRFCAGLIKLYDQLRPKEAQDEN